jgi:membrane protease YdiL (CAAX protease family)
LDDLENIAIAPVPETPVVQPGLVAPLWHTALIILLAAAASIAGARGSKHFAPASAHGNLPSYVSSIALELVLTGIVLWGLRLGKTPLRVIFGEQRPGLREWFIDAGSAAVFWIVSLTVLGTLAVALQHAHLHPEKIRTTVSKLAPYSAPELIAWTALSITAGICEEFIFRGYLQLQFARLGHRIWIGVVSSALIFGFAHGYEGLSGMLLIVAFGALFSVLRLVRGNLRAGMMAHAWHDFLSGMVLSLIAHHKLFPLN